MSTILDTYKNSQFAKLGKTDKDKTPLSVDNKTLQVDETKLKKARGGQLQEKPYSNTIKK